MASQSDSMSAEESQNLPTIIRIVIELLHTGRRGRDQVPVGARIVEVNANGVEVGTPLAEQPPIGVWSIAKRK